MYSAKTLLFWFLVLYIRVYRWFEYGLLRLLRSPINKLATRMAATRGIIISDKERAFDDSFADASSSLSFIHIEIRNPNTLSLG